MDPGATLRHAREQRRLTIGQIADATKISLANLQALEASDFERLPAAVYARGFVRAYAREVGLDPAEMSEQYSRAMDDALTVNALERRAAAVEAAAALAEEQAAARSAEAQREAAERRAAAARRRAAAEARLAAAVARYRQAKRAGVAGVSSAAERITSVPSRIPAALPRGLTSLPRSEQAAAAVIVLVLVVSAIAFRDVGKAPGVATAQAVQAGLAPAAVPAPTSAQSDAVPAAQVVHDGLTIELKTSGPCWVSASADRSPVFSRLMQSGEERTIGAQDELVMRVGEPSALSVTINGEPARPIGRPGTPVTVQINRDNYRDFLMPTR